MGLNAHPQRKTRLAVLLLASVPILAMVFYSSNVNLFRIEHRSITHNGSGFVVSEQIYVNWAALTTLILITTAGIILLISAKHRP